MSECFITPTRGFPASLQPDQAELTDGDVSENATDDAVVTSSKEVPVNFFYLHPYPDVLLSGNFSVTHLNKSDITINKTPKMSQMAYIGKHPTSYKDLNPKIVEKLEHFLLLVRLGEFDLAYQYETDELQQLPASFAVCIVRAEARYLQNAYGELVKFIDKLIGPQGDHDLNLSGFGQAEFRLLVLFQAIGEVYCHGRLRRALNEARKLRQSLMNKDPNHYSELEIHGVEMYLRILRFGSRHSNWVADFEYEFPFYDEPNSSIVGFLSFVELLTKRGLHPQASSILGLLYSETNLEEASVTGTFERLVTSLQSGRPANANCLLEIYVTISYSRFLSTKGKHELGKAQADIASGLLKILTDRVTYRTTAPRMAVWLGCALLESSPKPEATEQPAQYTKLAREAERAHDYGLEDYCLGELIRSASNAKDYQTVFDAKTRYERLTETLEVDLPSLLAYRHAIWNVAGRMGEGSIMSWYDKFDQIHPISPFLLGESESNHDMLMWDIPTGRQREENIKYIMSKRFKNNKDAATALRKASALARHVDFESIRALGLKDDWSDEWFSGVMDEYANPLHLDCLDILQKRLRQSSEAGDLPTELVNDILRDLQLGFVIDNPANISNQRLSALFFEEPWVQEGFDRRIKALQTWFLQEPIQYSVPASEALIVQILLKARSLQVSISAADYCNQKAIEYIDGISDKSLTTFFRRDRLLCARLRLESDMQREDARTIESEERLIRMLQEWNNLAMTYQNSHLAGQLDSIAACHVQAAVIADLLMRNGRKVPRNIQDSLRTAEKIYEDHRKELSVLQSVRSLTYKSLAGNADGHRLLLHVAIGHFVWQYQQAEDAGDEQGKIAAGKEVWNWVQKSKSRALNDAIGSNGRLSKEMAGAVNRSPAAQKAFREWETWKTNVSMAISNNLDQNMINWAREQLRNREIELAKIPELADLVALIEGKSVTAIDFETAEILKLFGADRVVLVDWFYADQRNSRALMMITWRPSNGSPLLHQLSSNIHEKARQWTIQYIENPTERERPQKLATTEAMTELQALCPLVSSLADITSPEDLLVLCATDGLHRMPLHALSVEAPSSTPTRLDLEAFDSLSLQSSDLSRDSEAAEPSNLKTYLYDRNRVVYTYSMSLLRLCIVSRRAGVSKISPRDWKAAVLHPLAQRSASMSTKTGSTRRDYHLSSEEQQQEEEGGEEDEEEEELGLPAWIGRVDDKPGTPSRPKVSPRLLLEKSPIPEAFAVFTQARYLAGSEVTESAFIEATSNSNLIHFIGHVRSAEPGNPLSAYMQLYESQIVPTSTGNQALRHIDGTALIEKCAFHPGAHVTMLCCGSGRTEALVRDELLGLVPAAFFAGARSVVNTLWEITGSNAVVWTAAFQEEWKRQGQGVQNDMLDLSRMTQAATKKVEQRNGSLGSWGAFVCHGYWRMPRAPVKK